MKKACLLVLALVLTLSLAACGGKDTGTAGNDDPLNRPGGSSTTAPPTSTPAGEVPNMGDILSGNGSDTLISRYVRS